MSRNTLTRKQYYSNCLMLSPEGVAMGRCSQKKVNWYLDRGFAEITNQEPLTIRLLFKPNGLGAYNDQFYLQARKNVCVVCGVTEGLTRHHCVPECFRKWFPLEFKEHASHDILLLCTPCHDLYETHAWPLKQQLVDDLGVPKYNPVVSAYKAATALYDHGVQMPTEKYNEMRRRIHECYGSSSDDQVIEILLRGRPDIRFNMWLELVNRVDDIPRFIRMWRQHFVDTMNPQYMPDHWNVEGRYGPIRSHAICN